MESRTEGSHLNAKGVLLKMKTLGRDWLYDNGTDRNPAHEPVTVLQIGEGNFLRGFFDWMIAECRKQGLYKGTIAVTQPRPGGKPKIEALAAQDGLYTLVTRGLERGEPAERRDVVDVFGAVFDPYADWERFLALADNPELRVVVSNTTEAGLAYRPEAHEEGRPVQSYPGKLTLLLHRRFETFRGAPDKGLICLPCELLERNGDTLRECILRYADDWNLPEPFKQWVREHNRFLNSLVDRIVTGYPEEAQAEAWFAEWGYRDPMLTTAEPYHLWAIEGEAELDETLPLRKAGLNVHWVDDLKPFQMRKVRILNGAHTLMTPIGIVLGVRHVREAMQHPVVGALVRTTVEEEIVPSLPMDQDALKHYAGEVYERFLNPFIEHRLADIAMNSLSKFKVRLLPSLLHYAEAGRPVPEGLAVGLAGLLRYYRIQPADGGYAGESLDGTVYTVRDDAASLQLIASIWSDAKTRGQSTEEIVRRLLGAKELWGCDLNETYGALASAVAAKMNEWERMKHE